MEICWSLARVSLPGVPAPPFEIEAATIQQKSNDATVNSYGSWSDERVLQAPNGASRDRHQCVLAGIYLERPMSLQVELCEHLAQDCLQAAERSKDPQTPELLLRHAVQWMRDALAALKQSRAARRTRPSLAHDNSR